PRTTTRTIYWSEPVLCFIGPGRKLFRDQHCDFFPRSNNCRVLNTVACPRDGRQQGSRSLLDPAKHPDRTCGFQVSQPRSLGNYAESDGAQGGHVAAAECARRSGRSKKTCSSRSP